MRHLRASSDKSKRAEVVPTHSSGLFAAAVERARETLARGGLVVVPTETVYGLAANAWDGRAVRQIFEAKGRPSGNPVIVHVASGILARECVREWPETADRLAKACWPGPLTLVLRRGDRIPDEVTAGGETVGVRWPSHPFMQALIRACGFPLAAPSANRSNAISPTLAEHALASLGDRVGLIIDGGASNVGIESTVVDLTVSPARVLRPGMVSEPRIHELLGERLPGTLDGERKPDAAVGPLRSPGMLAKHYAPRARIWVGNWRDDRDLRDQLARAGVDSTTAHVLAHHVIPGERVASRVCVIPADAEAFARALYAEWHLCDSLGAKTIVMEAVPDGPEWRAIADRLVRAAAPE